MSRLDTLLKSQATKRAAETPEIDYSPYVELLKQNTYKQQAVEAKPKVSWWKKLISVLSTGETGHAAYQFLEGKNPLEEYGKDVVRSIQGQGFERKTYADVLEKVGFSTTKLSQLFPDLYTDDGKGAFKFKKSGFLDWSANGTAGLAMDILLDPKTYLGGAGLFMRMGTKGKHLTEAGLKVYDNFTQHAANHIAKTGWTDESVKYAEKATALMEKKLASNPDMYYKGVTLFGQNVVPRKVALAPGRLLDHTMQNIPVLNKVYDGAIAGVQDVFKYGADVIRKGKESGVAAGEMAESYVKLQQQMMKRSRELGDDLFSELNDTYKLFKKTIPKEQREAHYAFIRNKIEQDFADYGITSIDDKAAKEMVGVFENINERFFRTEAEAYQALNKEMYQHLSGYMPAITTKEGMKALKFKNANKFAPKGYSQFSTAPEKQRTLWRFIKDDGTTEVATKDHLGLQEFSKRTEEAFLTKQANRLIKNRTLHLSEMQREIQKLTKEQLHEALRPITKEAGQKVASLTTMPAGLTRLVKVGDDLYKKRLTTKAKYVLNTAELKKNETLQFVENILNLPKKNVEKLAAQISTKNRKVSELLYEMYNITEDLKGKVSELPDVQRWFKDAKGSTWRIERAASISEKNALMKDLMAEAGFAGKPFFMTDPFEMTLARGLKSARNIAAAEHYKKVADTFGIQGQAAKTYTRSATTRKTALEVSYPDVLKDGIRYVDPKIKDLPKGTLLPDFLVEDMKKVREFVDDTKVQNQILSAYDKILGFWKGSVYGWYPASHGQNMIGGIFNNWLAGVRPKYYGLTDSVLRGTGSLTTDSGLKIPYKEIKAAIHRTGILGQTGYLDINDLGKSFNPSLMAKTGKIPRKAMEAVEDHVRVPLFLDELAKTNSFEAAAKKVFKYHFDYSPEALTSVERNVMKRMIPFYRWSRANIPLMLEEFIAQPGKMTSVFKGIRETQDEQGNAQMDLLPSYLEKSLSITKGGETMASNGMPPVEMLKFLRNPVRQLESGLTPFLKIPVELRTNYSLFKDKAIDEDDDGSFAENYPQAVKDFLQFEEKTIEKDDGTSYTIKTVDPMRKYWLYALPTSRLASILTSIGGEREKNKVLNALTGIRTFEMDMEQLKESQERTYEKKLIEIFTNAGLFGQINYPFSDTQKAIGITPKPKKGKGNPYLK